MAGFFDRVLSGKYPRLESLLTKEFERIIDEVFTQDLDDFESLFEEQDGSEVDRLNAIVEESAGRIESLTRELATERAERKALRYKLDRVLEAVGSSRMHGEPL